MNKAINDRLKEIVDTNKMGFMGHIIAGFPDYKSSIESALGICKGGADFIEVQFPFSDPPADGPTIEGACYDAINKGFTVDNGFKLVKELSDKTSTIVIIMTYGNIIFKYGIEKFIKRAKESGAKGVIIPDLPFESDEGLDDICKRYEIANIYIASPGADADRIKLLSGKTDGFLYTVARRGITGRKSEINDETKEWFDFVRKNSNVPIAIGFGIRSKEQIEQLKNYCNIAIVGSHFVKIIKESYKANDNLKETLYVVTKDLAG